MFDSIIILGPTASGKTSISIKLAKLLNTEIINADSMQIYKNLNIGTAKPSKSEQDGIKHNLLDFVEPNKEFSVEQYRELALPIIKNLINNKKVPIIVGGTGFYIESLLNNYSYGKSTKNIEIREKYNKLALDYGNEYVYNILKKIDPVSAEKIHSNDLKRVIRAIEIFDTTGIKKSEISTMQTNSKSPLNPLIIALNWNRDELYERINKRVNIMLENGLINEVKDLLKLGINSNNQCMQGIGYKEIVLYLENKLSLTEATELIKQSTRRYAKRQITWFKRIQNAVWFNLSLSTQEDVIKYCLNEIKK